MEGEMGEAKSANGREFMGFSYHYGGNSWDPTIMVGKLRKCC